MSEKIVIHDLPGEFDTLELYPLSDLHIGDPLVDQKAFDQFCKMILAAPNRYLLSMGDLMNNNLKSSVGSCYEDNMRPKDQKAWLKENLRPLKDRFLLFMQGNHEARSERDADNNITEDIAESLGKRELCRTDEAILKITFGKKENGKRNCYSGYAIHGNGGGKRPGGVVNNIELLGLSIDADFYVMGHAHRKIAYKSGFRRIDTQNNKVLMVERLFVVSSAWTSFGGYAARKMLIPSAKGSVPIILHGREKRADAVV